MRAEGLTADCENNICQRSRFNKSSESLLPYLQQQHQLCFSDRCFLRSCSLPSPLSAAHSIAAKLWQVQPVDMCKEHQCMLVRAVLLALPCI